MDTDPSRLPRAQRIALAGISGIGPRYAWGWMNDRPLEEALAELHEITRDPALLGRAMGGALAEVEAAAARPGARDSYRRLAEIYAAAGADTTIAAAHCAWHLERTHQRGYL